jgi:hypothetical protein
MRILTMILMEQLLPFSQLERVFNFASDNATGNFVKRSTFTVKLALMHANNDIENKIITSGNECGCRRTYKIKW